MTSWLSAIALLLAMYSAKEAECETITDIIQTRPELKKLSAYFQGSSTATKLSQIPASKKYTFFAPSDAAFDIVPAHIVQTLRKSDGASKSLINDLLLYHTLTGFGGSTVSTTVMDQKVKEQNGAKMVTNRDGAYVFFRAFEGEFYVNGAKVIVPDLVAENGMVHIIDHLFNVPGQSSTAAGYIAAAKQGTTEHWTSEFNKLLVRYTAAVSAGKLIEGSSNYFASDVLGQLPDVTVFVPSDEVISQLSANSQNKLFNDINMLQQVVESHVIYGGAYHSSLLLKFRTALALKGSVQTRTFNNQGASLIQPLLRILRTQLFPVNIKNDCVSANIISSNITVTNGVVHVIDGLLGWVSTDAWTELREISKYRQFYNHVNSGQEKVKNLLSVGSGVAAVPESERLTVFAPTNLAFKDVALTQDVGNLQKVVKMHVIRGTMDVMDMVNGTERDTLATEDYPSSYKARFHQIGGERFVEVDYVKAKLLNSGKCVTNGIIYQISAVLGGTSELILEHLQSDPSLSSMYDAVMNIGLATSLMDASRSVTLFVPTNAAFEEMRDPTVPSTGTHTGRSILDNERNRHVLQRVIYRHMLALSSTQELFLDTSLITQTTPLQMEFGEITLVPMAGGFYLDYGSVRAKVVTANQRMKNGVIHLIDHVLFSEDPTSSEWTAASSSPSPLYFLSTNALSLLSLVLLFTFR
ncbi:hypothetical protein CAPTEDRAFT_227252 [Capitella teleta]|uniref:FAS1 domain-containing protein n=1 Tax=Capitella teleta TaxID=283909 RepID=R7UES0_CAPTE|nr:hypothetical protein CAPTEDRAFT_227252 [Capitella teleta]|eukprot:ELU04454.1 hypothetical protein CAPTEDRAFT_227252 [Capitella teleta]